MDKQLFDDAIGEVPPSTVNVEASIARGRRAARLRSVANPVAAAGLVVVLAVGVIAYTMTRGDSEGGVQVGGPPASTTAPPTSSPANMPSGSSTETKGALPPDAKAPEACSRPNLETGAQAAARLTPVVKAAVNAQRPDLQLTENPSATYPEGVPHAALDVYQVTGEPPVDMSICDKDSGFYARATTKGPEGDGNLLIVLFPYFFDTLPGCEDEMTGPNCEELHGPHGEKVVKTTDESESGVVVTQVSVLHADGTLIRVNVQNTGGDVRDGNPASATSMPLTDDQLVAIATDPGLTLFP
jgi:hypothetical protein